MKIPKLFLSIAITASFFVGCKDTASKPTTDLTETSAVEKKEVVAAVKPETANFKIEGMTCAMGCAKTIEKKLATMDGVQNATVDFDKKEATVEFDATIQTPEKITAVVESAADGKTYKVSSITVKPKA
jgi:mercuric ion binding protein